MYMTKKHRRILRNLFAIYMIVSIILPSNLKIYKKFSYGDAMFIILFLSYFTFIIQINNKKLYLKFKIKRLKKNKLIAGMNLLFIIMIISVSYSAYKGIALNEAIRFLSYILIGCFILNEINDKNSIKLILEVFIFSTFALNIIGVLQYFTKLGVSTYAVILENRPRVEATLGNPNSFGAYLAMSIFPCFMLYLYESNKKKKAFYGINAVLTVINLILTYSRNSWLAFGIGLVFMAIIYSWKFIIAILLGGVAAFSIPSVMERIKQFKDSSQNISRLNIWKTALKMIKEHPLSGVGNGNFSALYDSYVMKYPELKMEGISEFPSHNSYLKVFSELGLFGFITFVFIIFSIIKDLICVFKKSEDYFKYFYTGFLTSAIVMIFLNIFDNILFVPQVAIAFWILVFLAESLIQNVYKIS